MKTKSLLLATVVGLTLSFTQVAMAKPEHRGGPAAMLLNPKVIKKLELTDGQVSEIKKIIDDAKFEKDSLGGDRKAKHEQFKALLNDDVFDEVKARAMLEGQQDENLEIKIQRLKAHHQILHVLSPTQREKLEAMRQARSEKREERRESRNKAQ